MGAIEVNNKPIQSTYLFSDVSQASASVSVSWTYSNSVPAPATAVTMATGIARTSQSAKQCSRQSSGKTMRLPSMTHGSNENTIMQDLC